MNEKIILDKAKQRMAFLFKVDSKTVCSNMIFGTDLDAKRGSYFKHNAFDYLYDDIEWIRACMKKNGAININEIRTVGDFCALLKMFHDSQPSKCKEMIKSWDKEVAMARAKRWRSLLYDFFGI